MTQPNDSETRTFTERRERGLTLDALQAEIEAYLGMTAERVPHQSRANACMLLFSAPSGAPLFSTDLRCFDSRGWCVVSNSGLISETADVLYRMHEEEVTIRMTRCDGEVVFEEVP